jgi:hypothetical protein
LINPQIPNDLDVFANEGWDIFSNKETWDARKKKSNSMLDHKNVTLGYTCGKDEQ